MEIFSSAALMLKALFFLLYVAGLVLTVIWGAKNMSGKSIMWLFPLTLAMGFITFMIALNA